MLLVSECMKFHRRNGELMFNFTLACNKFVLFQNSCGLYAIMDVPICYSLSHWLTRAVGLEVTSGTWRSKGKFWNLWSIPGFRWNFYTLWNWQLHYDLQLSCPRLYGLWLLEHFQYFDFAIILLPLTSFRLLYGSPYHVSSCLLSSHIIFHIF